MPITIRLAGLARPICMKPARRTAPVPVLLTRSTLTKMIPLNRPVLRKNLP